ncbi:MAG TPA: ABC transporter ATP-binding protein [Candidatus Dormibacteraeota bacterium]
MEALLEVTDLRVVSSRRGGSQEIVRGVSFEVREGESVALVGESGSGKSLTMLAVMGLLGPGLSSPSGDVRFSGHELRGMPESRLRQLRGAEMAMIYQDPMTSLNPMMRIGDQVAESLTAHGVGGKEAALRARKELARVGIPDPDRTARAYPHEFSGGMRQRAMIATALVTGPKLLIADEPTTALDVTIQEQILALIRERQRGTQMATIWITHDLGVVAQLVTRVLVMYAGRIVEDAPVRELFAAPQHPYTAGLLASLPHAGDIERAPLAQIGGAPPAPGSVPQGCSFRPRCSQAVDKCLEDPPLMPRHASLSACWVPREEWT